MVALLPYRLGNRVGGGGGPSLRSETQACRPVLGFRDGEAELPVARSAGGVS